MPEYSVLVSIQILMFYTCVSFCPQGGEGWFPSMHHRSHDQGVCIQEDSHPGSMHQGGFASRSSAYRGSASGGGSVGHISQDTWDTMGYGQQAGGMHPTRMFSCTKMSRERLCKSFKSSNPLYLLTFSIHNARQVQDFVTYYVQFKNFSKH